MKTSLKVIAASLALFAAQAQASPINVGGVVWDPDTPIWDFTTTDTMVEGAVNTIGQVVTGYGLINNLNSTAPATFCPSCELTYTFSYTLNDIKVVGTETYYIFTGGVLNVYVDNAQNYNSLSMTSAMDGTLFLSLAGHTFYDPSALASGTLISDPTPALGVLGNGAGYLDVTGGIAAGNFDTNTIPVLEGVNAIGVADFSYTSSFQLLPNAASYVTVDAEGNEHVISMFGSNDLQGSSIPEPGTLALAGLGLLGFGAMRRRKV